MPCASDQLPHKQLTTKTRVFVCDRANAGSYDNILSSSFDNRQNDRLVYCKTYIEVNKVTHLPLTDSLLPNDLRNVISLFEEAVSGSYKQGDLWILLNQFCFSNYSNFLKIFKLIQYLFGQVNLFHKAG